MIKIEFLREEINYDKFWEALGGVSKLKEKTDIISAEKLYKEKEEICIVIPQMYFRGIPFKFGHQVIYNSGPGLDIFCPPVSEMIEAISKECEKFSLSTAPLLLNGWEIKGKFLEKNGGQKFNNFSFNIDEGLAELWLELHKNAKSNQFPNSQN